MGHGRSRPTSAVLITGGAQYPIEARLRGEILPGIGQPRYDLSRRQARKLGAMAALEHRGALARQRPVVGLLTSGPPRSNLLGIQTSGAAVLGQLRFTRGGAFDHGGELIPSAPAFGPSIAAGSNRPCERAFFRHRYSEATDMPSSRATSSMLRLWGGISFASTAALRSSEF
jgi:hypothetical protein